MTGAKFSKGEKVRVTNDKGDIFEGTVSGMGTNLLTFEVEYDLDYWDEKQEAVCTKICIPKKYIERI